MNIGKMLTTTLMCVSLLGLSIPCMANEMPAPESNSQKAQQEEAVIIRIDQNNVTVQALNDKTKKITAPFSNASEFSVGDKVVLVGNTLKKASNDTKADPSASKM